jgi:hypothetical protein
MTYFRSKHVDQLDAYTLLSNKDNYVESGIYLFIYKNWKHISGDYTCDSKPESSEQCQEGCRLEQRTKAKVKIGNASQ